MPMIRSSAELRNSYTEISQLCHEYAEPIFITRNGKGDLAVMSIEAYDRLVSRLELTDKLLQGLEDVENENTRPFADAIADIKSRRK